MSSVALAHTHSRIKTLVESNAADCQKIFDECLTDLSADYADFVFLDLYLDLDLNEELPDYGDRTSLCNDSIFDLFDEVKKAMRMRDFSKEQIGKGLGVAVSAYQARIVTLLACSHKGGAA